MPALTFAEIATAAEKPDAGKDWLAGLPDILEYTGEFGAELVLFLPFMNWLAERGLLRRRAIRTYRGMRCFYDDLDCAEIIEKEQRRNFVRPVNRPQWLPVRNEHTYGPRPSPFHVFPDLRRKFSNVPLSPSITGAEKPLLVLHNKATTEGGCDPANAVNVIPLDVLDTIFTRLKADYTVVYVRHGPHRARTFGYSADHQSHLPFEDGPLLDRHPEVLRFGELFAQHRREFAPCDVNTFKSALYARCHRFISSQGGGAMQIALYSASLVAILHKHGRETAFAYDRGYYHFVSDPRPTLIVCESDASLLTVLPRFAARG